jgi:hypothetical protein
LPLPFARINPEPLAEHLRHVLRAILDPLPPLEDQFAAWNPGIPRGGRSSGRADGDREHAAEVSAGMQV